MGPAFEVGEGTDNSRIVEALTITISTLREIGFSCTFQTTDSKLTDNEFLHEQVELDENLEFEAKKGDLKLSFCAHGILPTWV